MVLVRSKQSIIIAAINDKYVIKCIVASGKLGPYIYVWRYQLQLARPGKDNIWVVMLMHHLPRTNSNKIKQVTFVKSSVIKKSLVV